MDEKKEALSDDDLDLVIEKMREIVRAGVSVTFEEYSALPDEAKAALILARQEDRAEMAAMIAHAASGPQGLALVMKAIDGGDRLAQLECESAVARHFAKGARGE